MPKRQTMELSPPHLGRCASSTPALRRAPLVLGAGGDVDEPVGAPEGDSDKRGVARLAAAQPICLRILRTRCNLRNKIANQILILYSPYILY